MAKTCELSVVVPVFQEEAAVPLFLSKLLPVLEGITPDYEIIFSMDPGKDRTDQIIREAGVRDPRVKLLVMTRRWGQPACTMAGIENCTGRACVVMDVDLQDPPELIPEMVAKWKEGNEVVYAQRRHRTGETVFRLAGAYIFYWIVDRISEVEIPRNVGDFRLLDRKVIDHLKSLKETHGYLRGLVSYVGYRQAGVMFDRPERKAGTSKYSQVLGSLRIFFNGIVAFSGKPLTVATMLGIAMAGLSVLAAFIYVGKKVIYQEPMMTGMAPAILLIAFLGGAQLICMGIMGEYISRIYEEVRNRPKYLVAQRVNFEEST